MTAAAVKPLRWSSVRDCPRKAVYEATGAPAREFHDRELRILMRGRSLGRDYADLLAATHGEDAIERERKVVWPLGVGHIDVYLRPTRTAVEVLSSANASPAMIDSKLVQVIGYALHDDEVDNVCLVILSPVDMSEERVVVTPTSPRWALLADEARARLAKVLEWRETGELPERVCKTPSDAFAHFCRHGDHCFDGWQAPEVELDTVDDPAAAELAAELAWVKRARAEHEKRARDLEPAQRSLERRLGEHVPHGDTIAGDYVVKRSPRTRSTFRLELARRDSRFHDTLLDEFTNVSTFDVYTVTPAIDYDDDGDDTPF